MKRPDKYGVRLNTKNFRHVSSHAARSIDYDKRLKIIEIEYITKEIYHYLKATEDDWNKFISYANKKEGLGEHISKFKTRYDGGGYDFYKLIVISTPESA
jgi:hypothetical protein